MKMLVVLGMLMLKVELKALKVELKVLVWWEEEVAAFVVDFGLEIVRLGVKKVGSMVGLQLG